MARDGKQVFRFTQQAFAAANLMAVNNYNMGATASSGAVFYMSTAGTTSFFYHGFSNSLNRSGFRDTNANQSILVSGETSAIVNDPAIIGNTNGSERYCHAIIQTYGNYGTTAWELFVQGASDSGTGTAGTDWTQISGSVVLNSTAATTQTTTAITAGRAAFATAHNLNVGDVIIPRTSGTGFAAFQALIVASVASPTEVDLSLTYGAPRNTALSGTTIVMDKPNSKRVVAMPLSPSTKPWARVMVRAIPVAAGAVAINTAAFVDQVFFSMGRDSAAVS